ncbi:MAG: NADH-quinone oxidoreductase subunit J [Acidimicrobiales bacterium]|jgi:NADH-quinone oxidoreductase subunit J
MEFVVFVVAAIMVLAGAVGVVASRHPVHSALSLVGTLFSVAVLFVLQEAHLLAAVQVIVYTGAIVVLFLFVIMLLGVDEAEELDIEPIAGQRPIAIGLAAASAVLAIVVFAVTTDGATGARSATAELLPEQVKPNINQIAEVLFTDYVFAFELTALLLTIAVVGAVVLSRSAGGDFEPAPESVLAKTQRETAEAEQAILDEVAAKVAAQDAAKEAAASQADEATEEAADA